MATALLAIGGDHGGTLVEGHNVGEAIATNSRWGLVVLRAHLVGCTLAHVTFALPAFDDEAAMLHEGADLATYFEGHSEHEVSASTQFGGPLPERLIAIATIDGTPGEGSWVHVALERSA